MTLTIQITFKCTVKFKLLQLIKCNLETDNNYVYVRGIGEPEATCHFKNEPRDQDVLPLSPEIQILLFALSAFLIQRR